MDIDGFVGALLGFDSLDVFDDVLMTRRHSYDS